MNPFYNNVVGLWPAFISFMLISIYRNMNVVVAVVFAVAVIAIDDTDADDDDDDDCYY